MSEHKTLNQSDLDFKTVLTQRRKIGGRIVEEEVHADKFDETEAMDTLLAGVEPDEIEEGREKWAAEHPEMLVANVHDMLDHVASSEDDRGGEYASPKRLASSRRVGKIMDTNGETLNFRRIAGATKVELYTDDSQVISTLSSKEFDDLLDSQEFTVL